MEKLYRVNESEHFNLLTMRGHLLCVRDVQDATGQDSAKTRTRIEEIESLLDKAYCVGARVPWPVLSRIRAIQKERRMIRYCLCLRRGDNETDAAMAFQI